MPRWPSGSRPSITDDSGPRQSLASQPMLSTDGGLAITFNGEILNAPEIWAELGLESAVDGRSDTAVLAEAVSRN